MLMPSTPRFSINGQADALRSTQTITVGDKQTVTDHLVAHAKGPSSDFAFEVFYARDPARTPLLIKIPVAIGTITLELAR